MARRIVVKKEDRHANRFATSLPEGVSISKTNISRDPEQGLIVELLYTEEGVAQMLCFTLRDKDALYAAFVGMGYSVMTAARAVLTDYLTTRTLITEVKVVHLREGRPGFDENGQVTRILDKAKYRCRECGCLWRMNEPDSVCPEGSWSLYDGSQKSCDKCEHGEMGKYVEPVHK